ncbi:hypothetical protein MGG_17033 [Pyricularia oryzae 70-15]|uniref:Uncharacterized protein n=3 Tax=Pyricularia oryzae TaxID=318829 RepID=G4N5U2_PYRO7|nr:uncharacterized protein MGG_17033 [Pyricularia oryzae 70-15]EHA49718.1 hypothetical protein MGG_17033 [Pyricularia oryzae 70-15]ELQ33199.1 hypothetical protein OOU_Y34scaffold00983g1 [Pyricularia oryzae Y34]
MGYPIWVQSATRGPPKPAKTPMGRPEPPAQSPWVDEPGRAREALFNILLPVFLTIWKSAQGIPPPTHGGPKGLFESPRANSPKARNLFNRGIGILSH